MLEHIRKYCTVINKELIMQYKDVIVPSEYYQPLEYSLECDCIYCWGTELMCSLCGSPDNEEGHCNLDGWEWVECGECKHFDEDYMKDPDRSRDERIDKELEEQGADCHD